MNAPNYQETLDYMYGLIASGIKLGLENTASLLKHFGDPQRKIRTIHLAGTNGKGSTAAFIDSILRNAGYRVGLYTSPHLSDFRERIRVDQQYIGEDELIDLASRIRSAVEQLRIPVTFFEFTTVMAFLYFFEKKVDWGLIEVGLGGRLDATNLCRAEVSLITTIGLDHTEYLGSDIRQIAAEKAAIIHPHSRVFANVENPSARQIVENIAKKQGVTLSQLGVDFKGVLKSFDTRGQTVDYVSPSNVLENLEISLLGSHQTANACLATATCLYLASRGEKVTESHIRTGLKTTLWPGRLEVVSTHPTVLLDCAHNPDGARQLARTIRDYFTYDHCTLILGIMQDKPIGEMLEIFGDLGDRLIFVKPRTSRSANPKHLKNQVLGLKKVVDIVEHIEYALYTVLKNATPKNLICITGSIFTVAEARLNLAKINPLQTHTAPGNDPLPDRGSVRP